METTDRVRAQTATEINDRIDAQTRNRLIRAPGAPPAVLGRPHRRSRGGMGHRALAGNERLRPCPYRHPARRLRKQKISPPPRPRSPVSAPARPSGLVPAPSVFPAPGNPHPERNRDREKRPQGVARRLCQSRAQWQSRRRCPRRLAGRLRLNHFSLGRNGRDPFPKNVAQRRPRRMIATHPVHPAPGRRGG